MSVAVYNPAVRAARVEPPDSLDFFPTPPPMTRALCEIVLPRLGIERGQMISVREPAAGEGHMAETLRGYFDTVYASDVHDYGVGYPTCNYLTRGGLDLGDAAPVKRTHWLITNPPFNEAADFFLRAVDEAKVGIALLLRTQWQAGQERYSQIFKPHPPTLIAQFVERIAMVKGRWDPAASTMTDYAWYVWLIADLAYARAASTVMWIPPVVKERFTLRDDLKRFAREAPADAARRIDIVTQAELARVGLERRGES